MRSCLTDLGEMAITLAPTSRTVEEMLLGCAGDPRHARPGARARARAGQGKRDPKRGWDREAVG